VRDTIARAFGFLEFKVAEIVKSDYSSGLKVMVEFFLVIGLLKEAGARRSKVLSY